MRTSGVQEAVNGTGPSSTRKSAAIKFVLAIGLVSLFADCSYEGARSITGQFMAALGATGTIVGIVAGLGELLGYGLRLFSGRVSERSGRFWPITIFGYLVQMIAVPLLAFAPTWKSAAVLILMERIGKAIRNPPRDVMLSYAAHQIGYGWGFGVHEALDQFGALVGPMIVALILYLHGDYRDAFALLWMPASITLSLLVVARIIYPRPADLAPPGSNLNIRGQSPMFWIYMCGAFLVAAGFADFQLMSFHFVRSAVIGVRYIPIIYSIAMAVSGLGSLVFGKLFDRHGIRILIPLTIVAAGFAPLVFLGSFWPAVVGAAIWGLGIGVHESIIPAAIALLVPVHRRPSAYGLFTAGYGVSWFLGSALTGILYDFSAYSVVIFCVATELAAIPFFVRVSRQFPARGQFSA